MKVLIACEESQEVCKAFRALGHEAYSCDIQDPSGGHPEWHILGDALTAIQGGQVTTMDGQSHEVGRWDLLIAHPPCTYLSNAGARHLWKNHQLQADRVMLGITARDFFMRFWLADVPRIAVENPTPSRVFAMPPYTQTIQPYEFGHPYTKRTCLWLKNLPPLEPTNIVERAKQNVNKYAEDTTLEQLEKEHKHSERESKAEAAYVAKEREEHRKLHTEPIPLVEEESLLGSVQDLMIKGYDGNLSFERDFVGEAMDLLNSFTVQ